jgi:hypothetical protein
LIVDLSALKLNIGAEFGCPTATINGQNTVATKKERKEENGLV